MSNAIARNYGPILSRPTPIDMGRSIRITERPIFFSRGRQTCIYYPVSMERIYVDEKDFNSAAYGVRPIEVEIPEPSLRMLQLNITNRCNMTCEYCTIYKNSYIGGEQTMSDETIDRIVSMFYGEQKANPPLVVFFGGEPMLAFSQVNYLARRLPEFTTKVLFTNGTILREEHIRKFCAYPNFHIVVSYDGTPRSNDSMRSARGKSLSRTILGNLARMRQSGVSYGISLVAHKHNIDSLEENVDYILKELCPTSLGVNLPHYTESESYSIDVEKYASSLIGIMDLAKQRGVFVDQINRRLKPFLTKKVRFRDCAACGEKLVFLPDGSFSNCVNYFGVLEDPYAWKDRIPILREECWDCCAVGICGGGCIVDGMKFFGADSFDQRNCYVARYLVSDFIWRFQDAGQIEKYACVLERRFQNGRFSIGHITDYD